MTPRVLETNCLHASDVLIWLDATSAPGTPLASWRRVDRCLSVTFTTSPPDLQWLHKPGLTVLWRRPVGPIVSGLAGETERARPVLPTFRLRGQVEDPGSRFNPRTFDLTLGDGAGQALALYPTPQATVFNNGGGLQGCLRWDGTNDPAIEGHPVPWAVLDLTVTLANGATQTYQAQADVKGDFRLALSRLPPLPEGTTRYLAELAVRARPPVAGDPLDLTVPLDPALLTGVQIRGGSSANLAEMFPIELVPGQAPVLRSFERAHLGLRPN